MTILPGATEYKTVTIEDASIDVEPASSLTTQCGLARALRDDSEVRYLHRSERRCTMDNLKKKAGEMMGGGVDEQLKDLNFPCSKDEAIRQLEQKGVPSQVTDRVRNVHTSQFTSAEDLKSKVGL